MLNSNKTRGILENIFSLKSPFDSNVDTFSSITKMGEIYNGSQRNVSYYYVLDKTHTSSLRINSNGFLRVLNKDWLSQICILVFGKAVHILLPFTNVSIR